MKAEWLYRSRLQDPSVVVTRDATAAAVYVSGGVNSVSVTTLRPLVAGKPLFDLRAFWRSERQVSVRADVQFRASEIGGRRRPLYSR